MKVVSPAGEFEITINEAGVEGESVVIKGQMGVWDSKIYLTPKDLWLLTSVFLKPSVLLHILKLPIRLIFNRRAGNGTN